MKTSLTMLALAAAVGVGLGAATAAATTLQTLAGRWNGAGTAALRGNPAEPFRCRLTIETQGASRAFFQGRCATAQGAQSFDYLLQEGADGTVTAQSRSQDGGLPARMSGTASGSRLHFSHSGGSMFELVLSGATLRLRVQGAINGYEARGEAFLAR